MLRVGLTGGLASGKSFVGRTLRDLGCHLDWADELGHEVLAPGGEAYAPAVSEFGPEILDAEGRISRRKLASMVFGHPERLTLLNELVHPAVIRREEEIIHRVGLTDPTGIAASACALCFVRLRFQLPRLEIPQPGAERGSFRQPDAHRQRVDERADDQDSTPASSGGRPGDRASKKNVDLLAVLQQQGHRSLQEDVRSDLEPLCGRAQIRALLRR